MSQFITSNVKLINTSLLTRFYLVNYGCSVPESPNLYFWPIHMSSLKWIKYCVFCVIESVIQWSHIRKHFIYQWLGINAFVQLEHLEVSRPLILDGFVYVIRDVWLKGKRDNWARHLIQICLPHVQENRPGHLVIMLAKAQELNGSMQVLQQNSTCITFLTYRWPK